VRPTTVLIADDDPEILVGLRYYLEAKGFHILMAHDGEEARQILKEEHPHVVVLDLKMPKVGGLTFLHELKGEKELPPIIVVTGLTGDTIQQAVEVYGVRKVLEKPVPLSVIETAIHEALGKSTS